MDQYEIMGVVIASVLGVGFLVTGLFCAVKRSFLKGRPIVKVLLSDKVCTK